MKYRSRPIYIEALRYDGTTDSAEKIISWAKKTKIWVDIPSDPTQSMKLCIQTENGMVKASPGDFVFEDPSGHHYPAKPTVFNTRFEEVK